jgi:hypothetical protein
MTQCFVIICDCTSTERCIEYWTRDIRITPIFVTQETSDVILVTCAEVDRREFLAWSYMFQILGLTVNFLDAERYNGNCCFCCFLGGKHTC